VEGQHRRELAEPLIDLGLEDGLLAVRAKTLAVNNANGAQSSSFCLLEKVLQLKGRFGGSGAMKVERRLDRELSALQPLERAGLDAWPQEAEGLAGFDIRRYLFRARRQRGRRTSRRLRSLIVLYALDVAELSLEEVFVVGLVGRRFRSFWHHHRTVSLDFGMMRAVKKFHPWLVVAGALAAMALVLRLEGRLWVCKCGHVWLWAGDINSADNSQQIFDPYSFTHVIHGFIAIGVIHWLWRRGPKAWQLVGVVSVEALWEIVENSAFIINRYRAATISIGYVGDTILNSFGDVVACVAGALIARHLGVKKTIVLAVAIEVILLLTIRDSLLLNIVMLIHPIEAIRVWQNS
jgi:hypothetical protein